MLEHTFVRTGVITQLRRSPLAPYLDNLAASLHHKGYAPSSIQRFLCAAEKFAQWLQGQGYSPSVRWMKSCYKDTSLGSHDTVPVPFQKRPKVWGTFSDSFASKASHVHGKIGYHLHRSISG